MRYFADGTYPCRQSVGVRVGQVSCDPVTINGAPPALGWAQIRLGAASRSLVPEKSHDRTAIRISFDRVSIELMAHIREIALWA